VKASDFKRIAKPLLPKGERWEFQGSHYYRAPVRHFVVGVSYESSSFDTGAYVWKFMMPLFVPTEHFVATFSSRIGGGAMKYYSEEPAALTAAIELALRDIPDDEEAMRTVLERLHGLPASLRREETEAYAYALLAEPDEALKRIGQATLRPIEYDWQADVLAALRRLETKIEEGGAAGGTRAAEDQARQTAKALRLIHV